MYMNLLCPNCGFSFGIGCPDDETEENIKELMTCPCGCMMEQTDTLKAFLLEEIE